MRTIAKGALKARMLEVFRTIEETGEEVIVTDNRRPVLRISPLKPKRAPNEVFASVRGRVRYRGNLVDDTSDEWLES